MMPVEKQNLIIAIRALVRRLRRHPASRLCSHRRHHAASQDRDPRRGVSRPDRSALCDDRSRRDGEFALQRGGAVLFDSRVLPEHLAAGTRDKELVDRQRRLRFAASRDWPLLRDRRSQAGGNRQDAEQTRMADSRAKSGWVDRGLLIRIAENNCVCSRSARHAER